MRRRLSLLLIAVLSLTLQSAVTVPAQNSREEEIRRRISALEKEIEQAEKELQKDEVRLKSIKQEKGKILDQLKLQEKKIGAINSNLRKIQEEESFLKKEVSIARKQYDEASGHIALHSDTYTSRLRSMYMQRKRSPFAMLFSSGSVSSFLWGFRMLSSIARSDLSILDDLRGKQRQIKTAVEHRQAALNAQRTLTSARRREERALTNSKKSARTCWRKWKRTKGMLKRTGRISSS